MARVMIKNFVRKCLYESGALGLYHRWRNADSLTVVMFHRTLRPDDPRWESCDPDYTLAESLFVASLAFFKRHYRVVSLEEVLRAHRDGGGLPSRALLITFDDGWLDNVDYAMPALRMAGLPAVMFVAADAIGARQPFYQERIIAGWRLGKLGLGDLADTVVAHGGVRPDRDDLGGLRQLIAQIERLTEAQRRTVLDRHAGALGDGLQHMVDAADLPRLRAGGIELGLHGKSHVPLTRALDVDAELIGAREAMATSLSTPEGTASIACATMSFPHGAFDEGIAARAHAAGYRLLFTSVPVLNRVGSRPSSLLGRSGYETSTVADGHGRFRPDWLASYLFRLPTRRLSGPGSS